MTFPVSLAVLDVILKNKLVWSEKYGTRNTGYVSKVFDYTTFNNLQSKIKEYFDSVELCSIEQEYDETVDKVKNKDKIYDFIPQMNERNRITLLDSEEFSIRLTLQDDDLS
jgi:hypothetical protein